jgi:hypothetical protein
MRRLTSVKAVLAVAVCGMLSLNGCADAGDESNRRPKVAISVLVDLSETWYNPGTVDLDRRVLGAVGQAIVSSSTQLPLPLAIRFHAIGTASLGREPLCSATYRPSTFSLGAPEPGLITNREAFHRYVVEECPDFFLARPVEDQTEIVAAIVSAERAMQLAREDAPKVFVILSDFKEESFARYSFRGIDLTGATFLLVYRTLDEDRLNPGEQTAKLGEWRSRLENAGASVYLIDENAVLSSPRDFEATLRIAAS